MQIITCNLNTYATMNSITVQASIGSSVTLTCTVSGAPLYWYRIGIHGAQNVFDEQEYEGIRTNTLKIRYLTANSALIYYCQLTNGRKGPDITVSISGGCVIYNYIHKYTISYILRTFSYIYVRPCKGCIDN